MNAHRLSPGFDPYVVLDSGVICEHWPAGDKIKQ